MSWAPAADELAQFQSILALRFGFRFDDNRLASLAELLAQRVEARGVGATAYLAALERGRGFEPELDTLVRQLTVGETYFFRHADQFDALAEVALPERMSARAASRTLRLLSAGCASGEEAYSLAILLRERGIEPGFKVTIQGVDINPDSLEKAERGLYSRWSLRETSADLRQRWFQAEGREFRLASPPRGSLRFDRYNLLTPPPELLARESFDIVLCRNVLMYFTAEQAARAVAHLAQLLAPGGFLFLGHAETLRGLSQAFHLRHSHEAFYYQLRPDCSADRLHSLQALPANVSPAEPAPARALLSTTWTNSWLETVGRSSERIKELELSLGASPVAARAGDVARRDLSEPLELLRHERFAEALTLLQPPATSDAVDPAALLLRAALLVQQGALQEAQQACHELIRIDDLNSGAHYLLALCLERRGSPAAAVEQDLIAIHLDTGFAMPHLHLGLMARRRGDTQTARHELEQAVSLLEREEPSRLLLFGGGFSRAALVALCRAELANLRGGT